MNAARTFVAAHYAHIRGGPEYEELVTAATLLDARMRMLVGVDVSLLEKDVQVEILCSQIASVDFMLATNDPCGAAALRATVGAEAFVAGAASLANAYNVTNALAKHDKNKMTVGSRREKRRGRGRGGGAGPADGSGRVECHRCGAEGHIAARCPAPQPK